MAGFGLAEVTVPVEVVPFVVSAKMTALARKLMARGTLDGTSLRSVEWGVGMGGYDPFDFTKVLVVDDQAQALIDPVFSGQTITQYEQPNGWCASYYCEIGTRSANFLLGEVGIWAIIQNSPNSLENGTMILRSVGHFPAKAKNSNMQMAIRVIEQM